MANVYGSMVGGNSTSDSKAVTRTGSRYVTSTIKTENGKLETDVWHDGRFTVRLNGQEIANGNTERNEAYLGAAADCNAAGGGGEYTPLKDLLADVRGALDHYESRIGE